jgi:SAM-dependent methyltransferase
MPEAAYSTIIERGYTPINDAILDWLIPRIRGRWLDIGCNTGALLSEVPRGYGVDASPGLVAMAREKGLEARYGDATALPFDDREFECAVLSCILEQIPDWRGALAEAERVAGRVIGVNPIPGASPWGSVGGWVRSVIPEAEMQELGYRTERMDRQRYYFESE